MASKSGAGSQSFGNFGLQDSEVRPFEHPKRSWYGKTLVHWVMSTSMTAKDGLVDTDILKTCRSMFHLFQTTMFHHFSRHWFS